MSIELFGFLTGLGLACLGGLAFFVLENGRAIHSAYGQKAAPQRSRNALIWPSH
jgi:hypothetical protein